MRYKRASQTAFAAGMIALGVFGLINGDFGDEWQSAPAAVPGRHALAYATAALMLACGVGLLTRRTERTAIRVLLPYWALMVLMLKVTVVLRHPLIEVAWQSMSELLVLLAAAWVLSADTNERAVRPPQLVFGCALIPLGLAHFVYLGQTAPLVPGWLPYHAGFAYFTGIAQIAAGCGVLFGVYAQLAATLEAAMLTAFTGLVWIPAIVAHPRSLPAWSEFTISLAVSAGAWVVAASLMSDSRAGPTAAAALVRSLQPAPRTTSK